MVSNDKRGPDNKERPYKLSDVKRCFPLASDPLIGRWIEKGYVSHGVKSRGTLRLFTFNLSEIIHIGVLMQASAFGITQSGSRIELKIMVPPGDGFPTELYEKDFLRPQELTSLYDLVDYDLAYMFRFHEIYTTKAGHSRNKKGSRQYEATLSFPWLIIGALHQAFGRGDSQFIFSGGSLLIHLGVIADQVGTALGMGRLWKPSRIMG